jgi:membrane associated rhomboid family serine protease
MILALIAINVIFSLAAFSSKELMGKAIFNPYTIHENREWWRFVTSGFIHADIMHLFVNMYVLYSFGDITLLLYQKAFGGRAIYYFLIMYFGGMIVAHLPAYKKHKDNPSYNSLGASGAISSLVFAFIPFQPFALLYLFFAIPIPAILFGVLYLAYSYFSAKRAGGYVNHEAHFWGAVFGIVFTLAMKPALLENLLDSINSVLP